MYEVLFFDQNDSTKERHHATKVYDRSAMSDYILQYYLGQNIKEKMYFVPIDFERVRGNVRDVTQ